MRRVSVPVMRRLPVYHHFLTGLHRRGEKTVSSTTVANHFGFDPIKVRKDLALTGAIGKPKIGFRIIELLHGIEDYLGWGNPSQAVLVGCGALGSALLGYEGFMRYGWEILMVFDLDSTKTGTRIHGKTIMPVDRLPEVCRKFQLDIGIITVPAAQAQKVTDIMVAGGVRGIWNFAPTAVRVPKGVVLQQENLIASLTILKKKLQVSDDLKEYRE